MPNRFTNAKQLAEYIFLTYSPYNGFNHTNGALVELAKKDVEEVIDLYVAEKINSYTQRESLLKRVSDRTKQKEEDRLRGVINASTNKEIVPDSGVTIVKEQGGSVNTTEDGTAVVRTQPQRMM